MQKLTCLDGFSLIEIHLKTWVPYASPHFFLLDTDQKDAQKVFVNCSVLQLMFVKHHGSCSLVFSVFTAKYCWMHPCS
jgi:hypothetical protein